MYIFNAHICTKNYRVLKWIWYIICVLTILRRTSFSLAAPMIPRSEAMIMMIPTTRQRMAGDVTRSLISPYWSLRTAIATPILNNRHPISCEREEENQLLPGVLKRVQFARLHQASASTLRPLYENTPEWVYNPFSSVYIDFNENRIASIITQWSQHWCWRLL